EPQGWTVLGVTAPAADVGREAPMVGDAPQPGGGKGGKAGFGLQPAWRGTLVPKTDADIWLATAFADYERQVANEHAAVRKGTDVAAARKALDKSVETYRTMFTTASKKLDVSLADVKFTPA